MSMEIDSDQGLLGKLAAGELIESEAWPDVRAEIIEKIGKIAHDEFPIPKLPPPVPPQRLPDTRLLSPLPSSPLGPSSQETNKENAPATQSQEEPPPAVQELEPGQLPKQIEEMLQDIKQKIGTFDKFPPHTIQRLAELALKPRAHYKALVSYLHAVDRVVQVTSGTEIYPLPMLVPDMSSMQVDSNGESDPALAVAWSNPTTAAIGSDEALGGALLTPIPWLTRRSPDSSSASGGAQIHSEGTETIEGPNGIGSIETVSVSVNGIPSTGHTRGVTQGELLRQEQRAGVVPVSQLPRTHDPLPEGGRDASATDEGRMEEDEDEVPHARGPQEIGVGDTGLQTATTSYVGESGVEMEGIDIEAAVGRKLEGDEHKAEPARAEAEVAAEAPKSPSAESVGSKREADDTLEGDPAPKKIKDEEAAEEEPEKMDAEETKEPIKEEEKSAEEKAAEAEVVKAEEKEEEEEKEKEKEKGEEENVKEEDIKEEDGEKMEES